MIFGARIRAIKLRWYSRRAPEREAHIGGQVPVMSFGTIIFCQRLAKAFCVTFVAQGLFCPKKGGEEPFTLQYDMMMCLDIQHSAQHEIILDCLIQYFVLGGFVWIMICNL